MQIEPIPYSFIRERVDLSFSEALWGYDRQLLGWSSVVDLAVDKVAAGSNDAKEIELASLTKLEAHRVGDLLREIVKGSDTTSDLAKRKWLYLVLARLFEKRQEVDSPSFEIELIYADFDYPAEMASFVGYMPTTDGYDRSRHTPEQNRARMVDKWKQYLERAEAEFRNTKSAR